MAIATREGMTPVEFYLECAAAEGQLSAAALRDQGADLVRLMVFAHARQRAVEELDVEALEAFLLAHGPETIRGLSILATVEAFYRFLVIDRRITVNPFAAILKRQTPAARLVRQRRAELGRLEARS